MIASRVRSWIKRSRLEAEASTERARDAARFPDSSRSARYAADLPAIFPRNDRAEENVQSTKAGGQKKISPVPRAEQSYGAQHHETEAHQRNHPNRKRAAGDNSCAIEQKPLAGNRTYYAGAQLHHSKQHANEHRGRTTINETAAGAREKGSACGAG